MDAPPQVYSLLRAMGQREVDMVKLSDVNFSVDWALEVKWSNHFYEKPGDLKACCLL